MESDSTLQRRRKPLVMCGKRKYRSGALGVHSRRERRHEYTHTGNAMGKRKEKKKKRKEMQNGDDVEA